jgi:PAS domain S-box-containing protein
LSDEGEGRSNASRWHVDLAIAGVVALCGIVASVLLDVSEHIHNFAEILAATHLENIAFGSVVAVGSFAWFAWRRWRERINLVTLGLRREIKVRQDAEEALKLSETRLMDAIESISEGFLLTDADDRVVIFNERYREIYPKIAHLLKVGISFETLVNEAAKHQGLGHVDTQAWVKKRLAQHLGPSGAFEAVRENGVWLRVDERRTSDGGMVGIRTDITALKQNEEALRESEELLRSIVDNSPSAIFLKGLDGRYRLANKRFAAWYDMSPSEMIGNTSHDIFPSEIADNFVRQDRQVLETEQGYEREVEVPFADGELHTIHFNKFPVPSDGGIAGVGVIGTDITARKSAELALRESEALLQDIVNQMPALISLKDAQGRYVLANEGFEAMTGVRREDIIGKTTFDLGMDEDSAASIVAMDNSVLDTGGTIVEDGEIVTATGHHTRSVTKFPIRDSRGKVSGVATVSVDITARKSVEEQLRQAQKMEVIGQLTGGVAHDFNNLLGVIVGNLDFLEESLEGGESDQRQFVETALKAAVRGAELTNRLLAFSRKQALNPEPVDLNVLVNGLSGLITRTLGETVAVLTFPAAELEVVKIDSGQLEAALLNLTVNARQAMPEGGQLTIETGNVELDREYAAQHEEVEPGMYAMLAVSDTGIGMTADALKQAFEPFFTTKEIGEGSGLGLSMVFGFVKQSGGHISIYSELGEGTTVKLYFPVTGSESLPDVEPAKSQPQPAGADELVLVVEDDPDLRALAVKAVSSLGYAVTEAADAQAALALLDQGVPADLLFTDVVLPRGMNGVALAAEARLRRPNLRVLYTSGYTENAVVHNGILDEGVELLAKPYRREELARRLRQILDED